MSGQRELHPSGLTRAQFECLSQCADSGNPMDSSALVIQVRNHLELTVVAARNNPLVNVRLAAALAGVFEEVYLLWNGIPEAYAYWLKGAMLYFSSGNDDEPDFSSPIGFEDDTEVLNACLRYANLSHLCLKVENYDDV